MRCFVIFGFILLSYFSAAQSDQDAIMIKKIYDYALSQGQAYEDLKGLCKDIGHRPAGSAAYNKSVIYSKEILSNIPRTVVSTQSCEVDYWERGNIEIVKIVRPYKEEISIGCMALGNSPKTEGDGILSEVVEVFSLKELESLGKDKINGKIVFFNRPMDPKLINTFNAYSGAVDQRVWGPNLSSELGAIGTIVRSMTLSNDDVPHTGVTIFKEGVKPIPAMAISTIGADMLSNYLKESTVQIFINTNNQHSGKREALNVIGEIKGSEFPDEIILVGGHLDSWDAGDGAHDDGAGCMQAIEVLRMFQALNYRPKRTIRCVLFANEEKGLDGAIKYASVSNDKNEYHIAAIESDAGGYSPRGFSIDAINELKSVYFDRVSKWQKIFDPYLIQLYKGGSGADINLLKSQKGILVGLRPDSQRYFDVHHSENDVFERVNKRELLMGAAGMTALVYLFDQYGIK